MRLHAYAGASAAAATGCLLKAFNQRPNFYSATVYLSQSNACVLILTNLLLVAACSFMYLLQRTLYGRLRPIEVEQLSEKAWYAVLDTLLAMPSFREDVGGWLLTMFVLLLAGRVWSWIGEGRVDILEQQPPANPRLFHARLATSLILGLVFSSSMLSWCVDMVIADPRPGMMVIFTFEFAILSIFSGFTLLRYGLSVYEHRVTKKQTQQAIEQRKTEIRAERAAAGQQQTENGDAPAQANPPNESPIEVDENEIDVPGWEGKRQCLFALELATDFIKLIIYIVFFTISITFNGLPMHIMRDVYMTFASFSKRVTDYVAYRKATQDMNTRYPDATTEEIRGDSCIVCRESMMAWEQPAPQEGAQRPAGTPAAPARRRDEGLRAKKLPCGHILHLRCLKAWLERQQVCPTCRRPVVAPRATNVQPGAPAVPGQPHQPGQQPHQRNRARVFRLGPINIGFLQGPGDQVQQILDQMRNPNQQAPQAQPQQQGQGPNHLGLQQPYGTAAPAGTAATATITGSRSEVPRQIQFMQLEERIVQDAYYLGVEEQQLATLRGMERELARLRAQHSGQIQRPNHRQQYPPHFMPMPQLFPLPQHAMQAPQVPLPQGFHGTPAQQFAGGAEGLPAGMTLPEGWTVMPLQRMDAPAVPAVHVQPAQTNVADGTGGQTSDAAASAPAPAPAPAMDGDVTPAPLANDATEQGPRDDSGSPLFLPTAVPAESGPGIPTPQRGEPAQDAGQGQRSGAAAATAESSSVPWESGDWSFGEQPASTAAKPPGEQAAATAGTAVDGPSERPFEGKGKGKAVEVEDAPDADA